MFGVAQCIPIYQDNQYYSPDKVRSDDEPIYNPLHAIDGNVLVVSMVQMQMLKNHSLQRCCGLVLLDLAVGRPGELWLVKFTDALQMTVMKWIEFKIRTKYASPVIHNRDGWKFNTYHAVGAFWVGEDGL